MATLIIPVRERDDIPLFKDEIIITMISFYFYYYQALSVDSTY